MKRRVKFMTASATMFAMSSLSACVGVGTGGAKLEPFLFRAFAAPEIVQGQQLYPGTPVLTPGVEIIFGGPQSAEVTGFVESSIDAGFKAGFVSGLRNAGARYIFVAQPTLTRQYSRGVYTASVEVLQCRFADGTPCGVRAIPAEHRFTVTG